MPELVPAEELLEQRESLLLDKALFSFVNRALNDYDLCAQIVEDNLGLLEINIVPLEPANALPR